MTRLHWKIQSPHVACAIFFHIDARGYLRGVCNAGNDGKSMQHSLSLPLGRFVAISHTYIRRCQACANRRKWNSSRFEGGVRYLYEPNFDETAKDYAALQQRELDTAAHFLSDLHSSIHHVKRCQEWFAGVTMVQLTLNHVDALLVCIVEACWACSFPACALFPAPLQKRFVARQVVSGRQKSKGFYRAATEVAGFEKREPRCRRRGLAEDR